MLLLSSNLYGQIDFSDSTWEQSKAIAKAQKRFLFVDVYAEWCGPCKWMEKEVFSNKEVASFYNKHFISYKADMELEKHKKLIEQFDIKSYPTFLYFDSTGKIVHKVAGSLNTEKLIAQGKIALDSSQALYHLAHQYQKGKRDSSFLYRYIMALRQAEEPYQKVCETYFAAINEKEWAKKHHWGFIRRYINSMYSEVFAKVIRQKPHFDSLQGKGEVYHFVRRVTRNSFQEVIKTQDSLALDSLKKRLETLFGDSASTYVAKLEYEFYAKDKELYLKYAQKYLDYHCQEWSELNHMAWHLYENEKDEQSLKMALRWAKKSVELDRNFYNTDTYAHLLYHFGEFRQALDLARESLKLGEAIDENLDASKALIQKIEGALH